MDLSGKIAVVTGASSGLGSEFAQHLVRRGSTVYGLARRVDRLKLLESQLGTKFNPVECDVTDETAVELAFSGLNHIDILINNAGLGRFSAIDAQTKEDWDAQIDTNLTGVYLCTRVVVPRMKAQNEQTGFGGHIINIASVAGLVGNANLSAYNATKFGLRGFSDATMKELRGHGIKVSCVCPGSVATEFGRVAGSSGAPNPMQPEDIAATVIHILESSDNYLISEVVMRPLRPRG
ncbi:MAG: SDR family NAD(P)-dependent oxidoreductase [Rhodothermaceae bacterium]|nr:SDR family NAD(P)-dependent oxidoreductase [Rhodothermaceae bacterium]MXX58055.1 SDR family NAD(P)-dependent oxidoreductase [Rhodothermaceae bacterium]MYD18607.1 SDR family NAD(P)-dependent oxidoreductase [Rhodothermaceae bacterium]MYD57402.1 SDR family NAD(P)-dependent oxidoreductase [Rhodothermaceae bacterium]MYF41241.1 SDR family NAD(P)-dependent oxidoreductase [Rhodothermaceae bacterium]